MIRHIPNILTLLNVFCGCCAIVSLFNDAVLIAACFILLSNIADFLDGAAARWLQLPSEIGKELDSLADMVSFGVVPGVILYQLLRQSSSANATGIAWNALPAFVVTCFSCYRLAKFNLDTRQTDGFIGLATPSCTIFCTGLLLITEYDKFGWKSWVLQPTVLYALIPILSYLLVSEIPMFSLKIKGFGWQGNELRWILILISIGLLFVLQAAAFAPIILVYVLLNLVNNAVSSTTN
jgi:CDP-diacylglycerol---serine O-phosphatidyltransferase